MDRADPPVPRRRLLLSASSVVGRVKSGALKRAMSWSSFVWCSAESGSRGGSGAAVASGAVMISGEGRVTAATGSTGDDMAGGWPAGTHSRRLDLSLAVLAVSFRAVVSVERTTTSFGLDDLSSLPLTTPTTTMSAKPITLLFLGATGETGKQALLHALSSPSVGSIHALGRTPPSLPTSTANLDKLTTTTVDFEALLAGDTEQVNRFKAVDADVVLITLGTTRAAAGDRFEKIDREYVVAGAKAARIEAKEQKVVYVSVRCLASCPSPSASADDVVSQSAGSNASSPFLYSKSKALTEQGIAALGYTENVVFRPGMLAVPGGRGEARLLESIAACVPIPDPSNVTPPLTPHM